MKPSWRMDTDMISRVGSIPTRDGKYLINRGNSRTGVSYGERSVLSLGSQIPSTYPAMSGREIKPKKNTVVFLLNT